MQKGFVPVLVLIVLTAILVIGGVFYFSNKSKIENSQPNTNQPYSSMSTTTKSSNLRTYTSNKYEYSIKYPADAKLIRPTWETIGKKPSDIIIKFDFADGNCIKKLMDSGVSEDNSIVECLADDIQVLVVENTGLERFIKEELQGLGEDICTVRPAKIGKYEVRELTRCLVGGSSFYYLQSGKNIYKLSVSENTNNKTYEILSTLTILE